MHENGRSCFTEADFCCIDIHVSESDYLCNFYQHLLEKHTTWNPDMLNNKNNFQMNNYDNSY